MKYWLTYVLTTILLGVFFSILYYILNPYKAPLYSSPIPEFLVLKNNNQVTLLDFWSPILETFASNNSTPEIQAESALIYDLKQDKVIVEKNVKERLPMASLTKIMTAIIVLEDKSFPETFVVMDGDLVGEDSMGLEA